MTAIITTPSFETLWYFGLVGESFHVKPHSETHVRVIENHEPEEYESLSLSRSKEHFPIFLILKTDCEIVNGK